jgi:hypothetical protein
MSHTILLKEIKIEKGEIFGSIYVEIITNEGKPYSAFDIPSDIEKMISKVLMSDKLEIGSFSNDKNGFLLSLRDIPTGVYIDKIIDDDIIDHLTEKVKQLLKKQNNAMNVN